jgi:hypothetical protein
MIAKIHPLEALRSLYRGMALQVYEVNTYFLVFPLPIYHNLA